MNLQPDLLLHCAVCKQVKRLEGRSNFTENDYGKNFPRHDVTGERGTGFDSHSGGHGPAGAGASYPHGPSGSGGMGTDRGVGIVVAVATFAPTDAVSACAVDRAWNEEPFGGVLKNPNVGRLGDWFSSEPQSVNACPIACQLDF